MQTLSAEMLGLVLNVHLEKVWRPLAARVCARWRAVVMLGTDGAPVRSGTRNAPGHNKTNNRYNPLVLGTHTLTAAAVGSHVRLVRWLVAQPHVAVDGLIVCAAAYAGAVESVAFFARHSASLVGARARYAAARGGQLTMLQWFHARDTTQEPKNDETSMERVDIAVGDFVRGGGNRHMHCEPDTFDRKRDDLHSARPANFIDDCVLFDVCGDGAMTDAVGTGGGDVLSCWGPRMCACAARGGHLGVLEWLRNTGVQCCWDVWTIYNAAADGHVHVVKWALHACAPPCPIDYSKAIEWTSKAKRNNVEMLSVILDTGYAVTSGDLQTALLFGQTAMADLILSKNPALWRPDEIQWWYHGTDSRCTDRDARRRTLTWAIARLDAHPDAWSDATENALTYGALVGGLGFVVESLRARGRSRSGHHISWDDARRLCRSHPQRAIDVMHAGCTGY